MHKLQAYELAEKVHPILVGIHDLSKFEVPIGVKRPQVNLLDKLLMPEWYGYNPNYTAFKKVLETRNIGYSASEGDNYRSAYYIIVPTALEYIPTPEELTLEIETYFKEDTKC